MTRALGGFRFKERLPSGREDDYVLVFGKGDEVRYAAWTTAKEPHRVVMPKLRGRYAVTSHLGETLPPLTAAPGGLTVVLQDAPIYLRPETPGVQHPQD